MFMDDNDSSKKFYPHEMSKEKSIGVTSFAYNNQEYE